MSTVRDLVTRSFRFVHIVGAGEDPTNDEAQDGLDVLNELIEQTAIDKQLAFFQTEIVFPFVPNRTSYTIGPSSTIPDVIAVRPVEILSGFTRRGNVDMPLFIAAKQDYDSIQVKNVTVSGWQQVVFYQAAFPKGTLFFYQVPLDNATEAHLTVSAQIMPYATLDDDVLLPPGYPQWLRYTLGKHLAPEYGMTFTPAMQELQIHAESLVKRNNDKPFPISGNDMVGLSSRGNSQYNIFGDVTRGAR